jgi:hypothetical protein
MNDRASFEVQILDGKRWVLQDVVSDEAGAVQFADQLISKSNHQAVRVVRDFRRADGLHSETVVIEKTGAAPAKPDLTPAQINDAPLCSELHQAYELPARLVIGRLFRRYLDEALITPLELLHNGREMKRLADKDRLLMSAVDQISALQAPQGGAEAKQRRDFLHRSWEQLSVRAVRVTPPKPSRDLTLKALSDLAAKLGDEPEFQVKGLMAAQLLEQRSWMGKLDQLLRWQAEPDLPALNEAIDGWIADILMPAEALQDLLGFQPNLGLALCQICDLANGQAEPAKFASESFTAVNRLFAAHRLPQAREALLNRVARELRSVNPLSRNEPSQEYEVYVTLLGRLISYQGVTGGPVMADALTQRHTRFHNMGGVAGVLYAVSEIASSLKDRCRITHYLLALAGHKRLNDEHGPMILRKLTELARGGHALKDWVPLRLSVPDRMAALTACHRAISACQAIPDELKVELATTTDTVLANYLQDDQVIEKIDRPEDPLAFRALRLVKFCCSGALIAGKSLDLANQRVLGHLRQAQFEEKFLASIPDQGQAERHLREFHRLLMQSGFKF